MILFYGEGRLGNQIFQYQALSRIAKPMEQVLAVGLEDLEQAIELNGPKLTLVTRSAAVKRLVKYVAIPLLIRPLARTIRLLNYASETWCGVPPRNGPSGEMSVRVGLIRRVTFVDGGHYQNALLWTTLFPTTLLRIKPALRQAARRYLDSICRAQRRPAFVHVRRADYVTYTSYGLGDLALPAAFYRTAIRELEARIGHIHLVFVTDDPAWVEEHFRDIPAKTIASFTPAMDFAIMTECGSGIVSNSTFSLAAAFMLKTPDLVIAPRYWFGFRVGEWFPPHIQATHEKLLYLPVLTDPRTP
jgi:Glycosyl transferase family 11